jgi:hypothetical protein
MASSTSYIHVVVPINISSIMAQAQPLFQTFKYLQQMKTPNLTHVPFCKNMYEIGKVFENRLFEQLQILQKLDGIMPQDNPSSNLHTKQKRVPIIPAIIAFVSTSAWLARILQVGKIVSSIATVSTILGTAGHLIAQSNRQEALVHLSLEESKIRDQEMDDLLKEYRSRLEQQDPVINRQSTISSMDNNLNILRKLNATLAIAKNVLPPQYTAHFNFDEIIPQPPPRGWESHPQLIDLYTQELNTANDQISSQIDSLRNSPYINRPPTLRLSRQNSPLSSFDEFMQFFLSLSAWDHQPFELPSPLENLDEFVAKDNNASRNARGTVLNWGALASVVSGTFLGMYSTIESGLIKARLNSLENAHNLLVHLTHKTTIHNQEILKSLDLFQHTIDLMLIHDSGVLYAQLDSIMIQWELQIKTALDAVQQAQHRRLAINLLDPDQLTLLHQAALGLASNNRYQLLPQQNSDYLQLEVSYARSGPDILLIIHVPCVPLDRLMNIYRFVPFPFPLPQTMPAAQLTIRDSLNHDILNTNTDILYKLDKQPNVPSPTEALFIDLDTDMIAINQEHQYKILTEADLAGCLKRNHVFLCEKTNVLNTDLGDTCLGALYFKSAQGVQSYCRFERRTLKEEVYQTGPYTFLVYSPTPYTTKVECNNGTLVPLFLGLVSKISIEPHCHVHLKSHLIQPTENFRLDTKTILSEWNWDPLTLPATLLPQSPHIDKALHALATSLQHLKTNFHNTQTNSSKYRSDTHKALVQLAQDATLDSEFESLLIKQFKTPSVTTILFWLCFSFVLLGCLGTACFCCYQYCITRRYPSLVEALESMQQLTTSNEAPVLAITPSRTYVTDQPV